MSVTSVRRDENPAIFFSNLLRRGDRIREVKLTAEDERFGGWDHWLMVLNAVIAILKVCSREAALDFLFGLRVELARRELNYLLNR